MMYDHEALEKEGGPTFAKVYNRIRWIYGDIRAIRMQVIYEKARLTLIIKKRKAYIQCIGMSMETQKDCIACKKLAEWQGYGIQICHQCVRDWVDISGQDEWKC